MATHSGQRCRLSGPRKLSLTLMAVWLFGLHMRRTQGTLGRLCPSDLQTVQRRGVCGGELAQLLSRVCLTYNSRYKKSADLGQSRLKQDDATMVTPVTKGMVITANTHESNPKHGHVFMTKDNALSLLTKRRYSRHNLRSSIVCECCVHMCQYYEITEYCATTRPMGKRSRVPQAPSSQYAPDPGIDQSQQEHGPDTAETTNEAETKTARNMKTVMDRERKQLIGEELLRYGAKWWDLSDATLYITGNVDHV